MKDIRSNILILMCLIVMAAGSLAASAQEAQKAAMTNKDVLDLVALGLGDDVVIEKIRTSPQTSFDTDLESLKALKGGHVSDAVIRVMINPKAAAASGPSTPAAAVAPPVNPNVPEEVGVYISMAGKLTEVSPEVVGYKTGGVMKSIATQGLDKGHRNGTVQGPKSALQVASDTEFIIRVPEGTAITEYQLLRLDMKGNRREFRAWTGGVFHSSEGAEKNAEKFESEKIAPRTFRVRLPVLKKGEYGFLPPGNTSGNIASSGKLYTFGIIE
ncbi:MAG: hypothetical protein JSS69_04790 [Acidobacteria bacterium]|nr:hypothetical protein [Acidobacteriota bacterium]MBS1865215.1 hypothetical protein [Acidobacteriota bacterium]